MEIYMDQLYKITIETIIFSITYAGLLGIKISSTLKRIPAIIVFMLAFNLLVFVPNPDVLITLLGMVYLFLAMKYLFNISLQSSLYALALSHVLISLLQIGILLGLLCFTSKPFSDTTTYVVQSIVFIIFLALYRWGHIDRLYDTLVIKNPTSRYILLGIFIFTLAFTTYKRMSVKYFMDSLMIIIFIVIVILILYTGMYKNYQDLEQSRKKIQSYVQYLPIIENLIDQVRMRQHDFNNELQAIGALTATCTDYESLKNEIEKELHTSYTERDIKNRELLNVNMKLIAGFLVKSVQEAKEFKYELNVDLKNMHLVSKAPEFELLDIFSILTDNAFEASAPGDTITICVDSDGEKSIIEVSNPGPVLTAQMRESFFSKGYSTKKTKNKAGNRGIGLYKLKQLIKKYDGAVALDNEECDGVTFIKFSVKI